MTHITKNLSDAILQGLYDTGHRFDSSWRQIILDIVAEFEGIGTMGSSLVVEDLKGFHFKDLGSGQYPVDSSAFPSPPACIHNPPSPQVLMLHESSAWPGESLDVRERWGCVGSKAAWFLERIRELNFMGTSDHRPFRPYGAAGVWWWAWTPSLRRLCGCLEGITWSVLIQYLSFIREKSNWTIPIMPGPNTASRDCVDHYERLMDGEVSGMGEGHVYECFNQEQDEELPSAWNTTVERVVPTDASSQVRDFPRREHVEPGVGSGSVGSGSVGSGGVGMRKKEMIHEILGMIEDNAVEGKINEQKYMELSDLLLEFHQSIRL